MPELTYVKVGTSLRDRLKELNDTELRLLLALGLRIDEARQCWPKKTVLAEECTRSERQVQRSIGALIDKGFIWVGRRVGGRGKANIYTLNGYFAYGHAPVQLIAPILYEEKGDIGAPKTASRKRETSAQDQQLRGEEAEKGDINDQKRETSMEDAQLLPHERIKGDTGGGVEKGDIADIKGDIGVSGERETSALADPYLQEEPYKKNHIRRTISTRSSSRGDPRIKNILETISQELGAEIPFYAKEGTAVKRALQMGFTEGQFIDCWRAMKKSSFWQGKWLPLAKVTENLGEFAKGRMADGTGRNLRAAPTRRAGIAHPEDLAKGW